MYPKEIKILTQKDTCSPMFIAALFTVAKIRKEAKCPSMDGWIKMVYMYNGILFSHRH